METNQTNDKQSTSLSGLHLPSIITSSSDRIKLQPTITIGTLGNSSHGKSMLVKSISGITTSKYSYERSRTISIKLGYANAKIYKCNNPTCPKPSCYQSTCSDKPAPKCSRPLCQSSEMSLIRHVSFIDCPGQSILLATTLKAISALDVALHVTAANVPCPQPQTKEHLAATEFIGIKHIALLQSKIDLVNEIKVAENCEEIKKFKSYTSAHDSPIIPISAIHGNNVDVLLQYIVESVPDPVRDLTSPARFQIIRSFDINLPQKIKVDVLKGAVVGGTLKRGILKIGDKLELRPGIETVDKTTGVFQYKPLYTSVLSLYSEKTILTEVVPGGLVGVGTTLDPSLGKQDGLVGQVLGLVGTLPEVYYELVIEYKLLRRIFGQNNVEIKNFSFRKSEVLLLNVGSLATGGAVLCVNRKNCLVKVKLTKLVCAEIGENCSLSRRIDGRWRLAGCGIITAQSKSVYPSTS